MTALAFAARILAIELALAAILFGSAGRVDLPWFWALLGVHATLMFVGTARIGPELQAERVRPAPGGADRWFRHNMAVFLLAHLIVAGLDVGRFGWSMPVPLAVRGPAFVLYAAGMALSLSAMARNPFYSPVVRIQTERGHHVVADGPYAWIRHPGYAGLLLSSNAGALVLGSWWSLAPLFPAAILIMRRLVIEDATLRRELAGYSDYADRVRSRLVPGVF